MRWLDKFGESLSRSVAHKTSRRSVLRSVGKLMVGSAFVLPVLPVARAAGGGGSSSSGADHISLNPDLANEDEVNSCDYWRHCAVDGFLCSCCGGTTTTCPPGSTPSPISWIGTCHNPHDGKDYLISYHDCCGKTACGRCQCNTQTRERPGYEFFLHNDVNWCMANENSTFHCTTSVLVGLAKN
ncbi:amine dehydrogenase [Alcaligenes faecalis]|uniref:methylamine dehydrogenase light chain n=3 Tax=Alcaligenes faecalis TaxID=511 RepID=UPI001292FB60|nr:methylamine dehydrogenase light chain [Alcaligenes faecalis]MBX6964524.1 amine dehydrogenase [Providencia rettgeri]MBX7032610.1 amine dehydrogenase [Alcaligenes faecalis]QFY76518.1 amine dehydrogenase [Alcaligenes faecalis]